MQNPHNSIYIGEVFHERHLPFTHRFKYNVFALWVDIDDLPNLDRSLKFFSFNRWNIVSINNKDHAAREGSNIRPWIESAAKNKGFDLSQSKIMMLCFPRLWGYVFNPITIYFCYNPQQELQGILYQVKNTFGEQHGYFLPVENEAEEKITQECEKVFHVSPFIQMDCTYKFRLFDPGEELNIGIHQFIKDGKILTAAWNGKRYSLTNKNLLKTTLRQPFMTLKIIAGIHWEALKLWIKGAKYIRKPEPPINDVS